MSLWMDWVVVPSNPHADILDRREEEFEPEDIGLLTGNVDIPGWLDSVRQRFEFLADQTKEEKNWAECNPRDLDRALRACRELS